MAAIWALLPVLPRISPRGYRVERFAGCLRDRPGLLGNFLGKVTKNFFAGIRTPWTLAIDEVWLRTHRLGGKLFVLAGAVMVIGGLLGAGARCWWRAPWWRR